MLIANSSSEAAAQRDLEPEDRNRRRPAARRRCPMTPYGSSLPTISSQRRERRDVQLLERAELLLAHDRHRRQVGRDDEQQQREHARDHEVAALELRVEPDADAGVDGRPPAAAGCRCDQLLRVAADEARRVAERHGGRVRVACRRRRPARSTGSPRVQIRAVPGGNRQRQPRAAALEIRLDLDDASSRCRRSVKFGEASKRAISSRLAARPIAVGDDDRHVLARRSSPHSRASSAGGSARR